jgi:peptide/nickel transport system substrate-binding protein
VVGAAMAATAAPSAASGQVIVGVSQEAINFNPLLWVNGTIEANATVLMFDSLLKITPDGGLIPNLATEVPTQANGGISPDGLTWTFKLKTGVKWHDGTPFSSKDVKFTWETVMDPNVAARSRLGHDRVDTFDTPDESTVKIKLKEPYAPFSLIWTQGVTEVIPEHILSQESDVNRSEFNTNRPVGTGPFKFVEHVGGDHLTVERNPDYHGGPAKLERVILKLVPELPVLYTQFKTGEVDVVDAQGMPADRWEEAQTLPDRKVMLWGTPQVEFIYFNNSLPMFQDKRVKQALYHAMDTETVLKSIYYNVNTATHTYLRSDHWAYNPDVTTYPYDMDKANALLDQAGWAKGSDGIRAKDGVRLAFTNSTTAGNKTREAAQQVYQQAWLQIGAEMTIKNMPGAVVWGEYTVQSQFDTLMVAWDNPISSDPDPTARLHSKYIPVESGSGANYVRFKNADADKLMEQGAAEVDPAKRTEIYKKLQVVLAEELPWAPYFAWSYPIGHKSNLMGYQVSSYSITELWNASEWYWA